MSPGGGACGEAESSVDATINCADNADEAVGELAGAVGKVESCAAAADELWVINHVMLSSNVFKAY